LAARAALEQKTGHFNEAIASFRKLATLDPRNASIFLDLGSLYYRQRKWGEARECLEQAARLDPLKPMHRLHWQYFRWRKTEWPTRKPRFAQ